MKRSDIEREISEKFGLETSQSVKILNVLVESMENVLREDGRIEIREFGSFTRYYRQYRGRNPKTGKSIQVSTKKLPRFRVSKQLVKKINS